VGFTLVLCVAGCRNREAAAKEDVLVFWHTQSDRNAAALREIIEAYNASGPAMAVREEYVGDYDTLYKKTITALAARRPPDLAVAYESMVADYMKYDAVSDLGGYLQDDLSAEDRADIYQPFVDSNRFAQFGGKLLSMPFTKSVLMLYYNRDMLRQVGRSEPPATWEEFVAACEALKAKLNLTPYAFSRDPSTFDGLVFSFGGEVFDSRTRTPLFDGPATVSAFGLIDAVFEKGLAYEVAYGSYDDRADFGNGRAAFFIRSSNSYPYADEMIQGKFDWDVAVIPHGAEAAPATVLFGANICVFKSDERRQKAAWDFIGYFISRDVTARWAAATGYLPIRQSALEASPLREFLAEKPAKRHTIEAIPYAKAEPNVQGWQEVRDAMDRITAEVINQRLTAQDAAVELQAAARKMLSQ